MTQNFGAFFFDSHQLKSNGDVYLLKAEELHSNLMNTEKYQSLLAKIQTPTPPTQNPNPHPILFRNSKIPKEITEFKESLLSPQADKLLKRISKKRRPKFPKLKRIAKIISEQTNQNLVDLLKEKQQQKQEIVNQVNDQRFKTQNRFLEKYLEMKQEISEHFERIIALKKVLNKIDLE